MRTLPPAHALDAAEEPDAGARPGPLAGLLDVRLAEGGGHAQALLTGRPCGDGPLESAATGLWRDLAATMAEHGIAPLQEKVYGRLAARRAILAARHAALAAAGLDPATPCTFHEGLPVERDDLAGVQLWGVAPRAPGVAVATTARGARRWHGPGYRVLHVSGVLGGAPGGAGAPGCARAMFEAAERALVAEGFGFRDVCRTWITLRRLLDWYGEFNGVRNAFFAERAVGAAPHAFPASTGIQGTSTGEECAMDLLAVGGPGVRVTPIRTTRRQGGAADYGSAFSRAMEVELDGVRTVLVSGTASVGRSGESLHAGQPQAQVVETLLCIGALLEGRGASLRDIGLATLYCKTPEVLAAYREAVRLLCLPALPVVPVVADICRPELLVEIEAVAFVPPRQEERTP